MSKFVIVTGGIMSNIGKGTLCAALGRLFKNRGIKVNILKFDQYLNIDPSTMSPYQHGEVYVTEDGGETDLDVGHYERFLDTDMKKVNDVTSGMIYSSVINKERRGAYNGATVQVVPNITNEIKEQILTFDNPENDIVIVEVGGGVSDFESGVYYHALRQLSHERPNDVFHIHVELLPFMFVSGETKIEEIQISIDNLNRAGLFPDAVVCRTIKNINMSTETKRRIAARCFLQGPEYVIQNKNLESVYELPIVLQKQGLDDLVLSKLGLEFPKADLNSWEFMVKNFTGSYPEVRICIVGKYTKVPDAYLSIQMAVEHACAYNQVKPKIDIIDSEDIEEQGAEKFLRGAKGIIVPPGWGSKGVEGMIQAIKYARENKIPYFGIGFGMQLAVVEFARNMLAYQNANSTELDQNTEYPVVDIMAEQKSLAMKKGTQRLGAYNCALDPDSKSAKLYGAEIISERHRHRFEFNTKYSEQFDKEGMKLVGMNPESKLIEIVEIPTHPFFVGTIFQPEFKSRPNKPHALFLGFINAAKAVR